MKKVLLSLSMIAGTLSAMADDYPYLTFETAAGVKVSVSTEALTITIHDGKLVAGSMELSLDDLSKMYFSTTDETVTTAVQEVINYALSGDVEIYDLQGRKVSKAQMRRGVYVIKTKNGFRKVNVK